MCGGAIISDFVAPARNRQPIENLLWPNGVVSEKSRINGRDHSYSNSIRRSMAVDLDADFEADYKHFKSEEEEENEFKPFDFSYSKSTLATNGPAGKPNSSSIKLRPPI